MKRSTVFLDLQNKRTSAFARGDWRTNCERLTDAWGKARREGRFTDVTFSVESDEDKQVFQAHKCVLAFGSPVFEAMFYGGIPEQNNPISIIGITPAAFENLLRYLYSEPITLEATSCAFDTYEAAERYDVPQLRKQCDDYISRANLNDYSVWTVLSKAVFYNMAQTKVTSLNYVSKNAEKLLLLKEFQNLTLDVVHKILECERLQISEFKLLLALTSWGVANKKNGPLSEFLKPLLKEVCYNKISTNDFCKFIEIYPNAFSAIDALALMKHIHCSTYKKPNWCSSNRHPTMYRVPRCNVSPPPFLHRTVEYDPLIKYFAKICQG
ncbi:BTB/POZ domain-containing protein 2, partial [Stegodyphus mimosarum]